MRIEISNEMKTCELINARAEPYGFTMSWAILMDELGIKTRLEVSILIYAPA